MDTTIDKTRLASRRELTTTQPIPPTKRSLLLLDLVLEALDQPISADLAQRCCQKEKATHLDG